MKVSSLKWFFVFIYLMISACGGIYFIDNYSNFNKAVLLFFSWATFGFMFCRLCENFVRKYRWRSNWGDRLLVDLLSVL
jgi:ABC-type uncharacterized transport system permease subunit